MRVATFYMRPSDGQRMQGYTAVQLPFKRDIYETLIRGEVGEYPTLNEALAAARPRPGESLMNCHEIGDDQ